MNNFKTISRTTLFLSIVALSMIISACGSKSKQEETKGGFNLTGTVEGYNSGTVKMEAFVDGESKLLGEAEIKDGQFAFNYDFPIPTEVSLSIGERGDGWFARFYAENANMTIKGTKGSYESVITGGVVQDGAMRYRKATKAFYEENGDPYGFDSRIYAAKTEEEKKKIEEEKVLYNNKIEDFYKEYIRLNPKDPYVAQIVYVRLTSKTGGQSAQALAKWAEPIDESIRQHPFVAQMFSMLNSMLETEAGLDKFVADAHDVKYKVDRSYKGAAHTNVKYLAVLNNDNLVALSSEFGIHDDYNSHGGKKEEPKAFNVQIINPEGKELNRFKVVAEGLASCIAADADNNIYVLTTLLKEKKTKFRGRETVYMEKVGAKCYVFNTNGEKQNEFLLEGREYATGARIYKDKLLVSDVGKGALGIYNSSNGKLISTIKDLRPCCSILDFDVDSEKGEILAANLGSFRVDGYTMEGKKIVSFGQRGRGIDDFHSCCNPVSVRRLHNGAVITVEKAPTRIKVYSREGAKFVEGIEELVEGCFHIPVMSDSKDNIYLASPKKGLVKCVVI
ncbi:MAG: DUF4369 domain-containing protein [Bacteroidales bacterium]|nr:DUF4369 domain-containing protein [Bacteroidales bacterium]